MGDTKQMSYVQAGTEHKRERLYFGGVEQIHNPDSRGL